MLKRISRIWDLNGSNKPFGSRMQINMKLLPAKAHYLLYFGGVAAFWPQITVFAKQLGISETGVGYIFTVAPIAGIICMPLFGSVADRFKIKKKLFLVFNIINLLAILCFAILSATETAIHRPVEIECGIGTSFVKHCHKNDNDGWNSTAITEKVLAELQAKTFPISCQIDCRTNEAEVTEFCTSLVNFNHVPPHICAENLAQDNILVSFKTTLKFKTIMPLESCLYMQIEKIAEVYDNAPLEDRGMSCSPQTKIKHCHINCPDLVSANNAMVDVDSKENGEDIFSKTFWLYAFFTILGWIAMAVVTSVADALCFQTLENRPDLYGQQRKWGAIGWGLSTLFSGILIDIVSGDSLIKNYTPCYWIAGVLLTLNFLVCWKWDVKEEERPKALGRRMIALVTEPKISMFIMACVIVGMCTGLLWSFLFWYIEDLAKARIDINLEAVRWIKLLQGLITTVQCFCGELPFFYLAGKFINTFGHVNSMAIVIGTFGVRFILYSFLENPWWVLPIELLQGLTYGIFYTNMATYAYVVSPEGTAATVQGIVGAAFEGIGVSLGSLIGGLMFHELSGRATFRLFGFFALFMCVLYKGIMLTIDRRFQPISQSVNDLNFGTEMKEVEKPQPKL